MHTSFARLSWLGALALASQLPAQQVLITLTGQAVGDQYGWALTDLGDVNDDRRDDFAVAAPFADNNGVDSGSVYIISGIDGSTIRRHDGPAALARFGYSVGNAGDFDGDMIVDVIVGSPGDSVNGTNAGYAAIYSGRTGAMLWSRRGNQAEDHFGWAVDGGYDFDSDGAADDVVVSAPGNPENLTALGTVTTFAGPGGGVIRNFVSQFPGERFGHAVSGLGDGDLDGFDEVAIGSPLWDAPAAVDAGSMRVYSGRTGAIRFDTAGAQKSSYFGWSVDGVSNLVGSPAEEVFVGSRFELDRGRAHIYNGENGGGGNPWRIHWGFVRSIWFGNSVASAGDVDSDGTNDLIVGSPLHGVLPTDLTQIWGQARVISGATGYTLFNLDGLEHMSWFGHAVSGAGNVNNDCCDDYMVGAPGAAQSRGQVTVFRGSRSSFSAQILGLSVRSGRTQVMLMDAGPAQANRLYFILGTMGGSRPGFPFGGFNIPLNPDSYFFLTVNTIGSGLISGQSGILDSSGRGSALLTVPGGQLPTTLIGYTMQHAYLVFDAQNNLSFVSNPLPAYFEF